MEEKKLVGVRFKSVGKVYYFSTDIPLNKGDDVIVETARGLEIGETVTEMKNLEEFKMDAELKSIIRKAKKKDIDQYLANIEKAKESLDICKTIVARRKLDMHLVHCEYTLDATKIIIMYTSDERVDFRELLKELASVFKCRIELRQIGPRDKAKIIGGFGNCGQTLCCASFLGEFDGVSINMAKNQMLAINIDKISGTCGRLMCCLKYEDDLYTKEKQRFPKINSRAIYEGKLCKVIGINILDNTVKLDDEGNILIAPLKEIRFEKPVHKKDKV